MGADLDHRLDVVPDPGVLASAAADHVVERAWEAVADHGEFNFAVSGGKTPRMMFSRLSDREMPWDRTVIYQVDERIAPQGDPARNLTHLRVALAGTQARVIVMPVEDADPDVGAARYGSQLPDMFDLVHLGIGSDGHTASLVPDDEVLEVTDRAVAVTSSPYQGHRRMTLTYPALGRARQLLWLVSGTSKAGALAKLLGGDESIPASRVTAADSLVMADSSAMGDSSAEGDGPVADDGAGVESAGEA